jgi:hypothetical protein
MSSDDRLTSLSGSWLGNWHSILSKLYFLALTGLWVIMISYQASLRHIASMKDGPDWQWKKVFIGATDYW